MFKRDCPKCYCEIFYKRKNALIKANNKNALCANCRKEKPLLERSCPKCLSVIQYNTNNSYIAAVNKDSLCAKCAKKNDSNIKKTFYVECIKCSDKKFYSWKKTASKNDGKYICNKCNKKAEYIRYCFRCNAQKKYKNKKTFNESLKIHSNVLCKTCQHSGSFFSEKSRQCPLCKIMLEYETSDACTLANKQNKLCKPCSNKEAANNPNYRYKMISNGTWSNIFGKTKNEWSKKYDIPLEVVLKFKEQSKAKNQFVDMCNNYIKSHTNIENIISTTFSIDIFNKKASVDLNYRPDFKFNDNIYLNADGLYWHSDANKKESKYHFNMRKKYENLGLRIFQFREDEILNKLEIIKSIVNNSLGNTQNKIGARKTKLSKISTKDAIDFLNKNHIKGYKPCKNIGLYYNNELVSIMSYKYTSGNILKIERFCSKINYNIVGAFNKLIKHIQQEYSHGTIHYWVDLRYGTGKFLLKNGFVVSKETLGWEWTDFLKTYNRLKCRANMDKRNLSEKEYAEEMKLYKIYDAGQRLYVKTF